MIINDNHRNMWNNFDEYIPEKSFENNSIIFSKNFPEA